MKRWIVRGLKTAAEERGLTGYAIHRALDMNEMTARKWVSRDEIVVQFLPAHVLRIAEYLGKSIEINEPGSAIFFEEVAEDVEDSEMNSPVALAI